MSSEITADLVIEKPPLAIKWSFGLNSSTLSLVHSLCTDERNAIFYTTANCGIIYDYQLRKQQILQGHCNTITCTRVSSDKRWIVTADTGLDSIMVVWDSTTALPIKTFFSPHPDGVLSVDISPDSLFLVTISGVGHHGPQEIGLWEWTSPNEGPLLTCEVATPDPQFHVRFNPSDPRQIVSNGDKSVIFWNWYEKKFRYYAPPITSTDFNQMLGAFTETIFLPNTTQALSGTLLGQLVVWESSESISYLDEIPQTSDKRPVKVMKVVNRGAVNTIQVQDGYIVIAGDDGAVRFYDMMMRLIAWFEDIKAGPITSLSFSNTVPEKSNDPEAFMISSFVVATRHGFVIGCQSLMFDSVDPAIRKGMVIIQGQNGEISALATHPLKSYLVCASEFGNIQLWDYFTYRLQSVFKMNPPARVTKLAFDPTGEFLMVGTEKGEIRVLDGLLKKEYQEPSCFSRGPITHIEFAPDGETFATADLGFCISLYKFMYHPLPTEQQEYKLWMFIGQNESHKDVITGLVFGKRDGETTLFSISRDRHLSEYDLEGASIAGGFHLLNARRRIEQTAHPMCCFWSDDFADGREPLLVVGSDEYKFKLWNTDSKTCRKTVIAPTYGGFVTDVFLLPQAINGKDIDCVVYGTDEKVIGLIMLPFDGNPLKTLGLIAHPGEISHLCCSCDGKYVFSAGGSDGTVNMWSVDLMALKRSSEPTNHRSNPYAALLEGGQNGQFYHEMLDYFYFSQLRAQGEDTTEGRSLGGRIPVSEIPFLMRAVGFYPSQLEIEHMLNEIKYSEYLETNELKKEITVNEFITLYTNHRPVFGIGKEQISHAFSTLGVQEGGVIEWDQLKKYLMTQYRLLSPSSVRFHPFSSGEPMTEEEINSCVKKLMGEETIPPYFTADEFATTILGFENY